LCHSKGASSPADASPSVHPQGSYSSQQNQQKQLQTANNSVAVMIIHNCRLQTVPNEPVQQLVLCNSLCMDQLALAQLTALIRVWIYHAFKDVLCQ
jgi:hypothetical protein